MKAEVRRRVLVVAVGTVVLLALVYGFLPKPVPVETAIAIRGPLRVAVEEEGRTRVKDRFVVSAPVSGYLRRIDLEVGDVVAKGRRIAVLEPLRSTVLDPRSRAEAEASAASARAALRAADEREHAAAADAQYARERANRSKNLFDGGYIARDDLDQAESEAKKAEALRLSSDAAAAAAKADLERAESVLRYPATGGNAVIVRSPVSGRVLKLHRESEGATNAGDPLVDIGNPRLLEVRVELLSADAVKIKRGMAVVFERWGGDRPLSGRVRVVEPAGFTKISSLGVEEQRVPVIVDFTSPAEAWQGLGDAYRLDASFIIWEGKSALQVPASALFRTGDGWSLFAVEGNRARSRSVEIGHRNGLSAEIVSGLKEGEKVVVHPDDAVKDGARVKVR